MRHVRAWNEDITFRHPVSFTAVGQPLPAGTYRFTFEEREIMVSGLSRPYIARCSVFLPKSMLAPNKSAVEVVIDEKELRLRQTEDASNP